MNFEPDKNAGSIFLWAALSAMVAATLRQASRLIGKEVRRVDIYRALLNVFTVGLWGGLSGWALVALGHVAGKTITPELLAVVSAVFGHWGHEATIGIISRVIERLLGVDIHPQRRRKEDRNGRN